MLNIIRKYENELGLLLLRFYHGLKILEENTLSNTSRIFKKPGIFKSLHRQLSFLRFPHLSVAEM